MTSRSPWENKRALTNDSKPAETMFAQGTDLLAGCISVPPHTDTYRWVGARTASHSPASIFTFGCCPIKRFWAGRVPKSSRVQPRSTAMGCCAAGGASCTCLGMSPGCEAGKRAATLPKWAPQQRARHRRTAGRKTPAGSIPSPRSADSSTAAVRGSALLSCAPPSQHPRQHRDQLPQGVGL